MFLMNEKNIIDINEGRKIATLRPLKKNDKGYFKIGSIQQCSTKLFDDYYLKVKITSRIFVDINELTVKDFSDLGYDSKDEYLSESFNKNNSSTERVMYYFEVVERNNVKLKEIIS